MARKTPPKPPSKRKAPPSTQGKAAPSKKSGKVVSIDDAKKKRAKFRDKDAEYKTRSRSLIAPLVTQKPSEEDPYSRLFNDPLALLEYHRKIDLQEPTDNLINAAIRVIRMGSTMKTALTSLGVPPYQQAQWWERATNDLTNGVFSPCRKLYESLAIADAQGEIGTVIDVRLTQAHQLAFLRARYKNHFGDAATQVDIAISPLMLEAEATPEEHALALVLQQGAGQVIVVRDREDSTPAVVDTKAVSS